VREFTVATGPDHYRRAEELLARGGPLTGEILATAQVHAMLALAAATALADVGRIEADAWREVAGTRHADLFPPSR
jgi:hypothetical protein